MNEKKDAFTTATQMLVISGRENGLIGKGSHVMVIEDDEDKFDPFIKTTPFGIEIGVSVHRKKTRVFVFDP